MSKNIVKTIYLKKSKHHAIWNGVLDKKFNFYETQYIYKCLHTTILAKYMNTHSDSKTRNQVEKFKKN